MRKVFYWAWLLTALIGTVGFHAAAETPNRVYIQAWDPNNAPYYKFYKEIDLWGTLLDEIETVILVRGRVYDFCPMNETRPFAIGSSDDVLDDNLKYKTKSLDRDPPDIWEPSDGVVNDQNHPSEGRCFTLYIPLDYQSDALTYFSVEEDDMVGVFDVITDTDWDGIGDNNDADDDGDGVIDSIDLYPLDDRYSADSDLDSLPDKWEISQALNPADPEDADLDTDGDGLTNTEEFFYGTSVTSTDTDHDSISDGVEIIAGRDPLTPDYNIMANGCSVSDHGLRCQDFWDQDDIKNNLQVPNAESIAAYSNGLMCYVEESDVVCRDFDNDPRWEPNITRGHYFNWPFGGGASFPYPPSKTLSMVSDGDGSVCYLSRFETGLTSLDCLNRSAFHPAPSLDVPLATKVFAGSLVTCWVLDDELDCSIPSRLEGGSNGRIVSDLPSSLNPDMMWFSLPTCAKTGDDYECWGAAPSNFSGEDPNYLALPNVDYQSQLVRIGGNPQNNTVFKTNGYCWINEGSVECVDNDYKNVPPEVYNVSSLAVSRGDPFGNGKFQQPLTAICALTDRGVICWGKDGVAFGLPRFFYDPDSDGINNQWYRDTDQDGIRDTEDTDDDNDGVDDSLDVFPLDASESEDTDQDGIGNNADNDDDGDSHADDEDDFPLDPTEHLDTDGDGIGNNADTDDDGDSVPDVDDAFPLDAREAYDTDGDGIGNNSDEDIDNDGFINENDAFPWDFSEHLDSDNDGIGNNADPDDDNDGLDDEYDVFPFDPTEQVDSDGDGVGDNGDAFPNDATETLDTDNDGIGNNTDPDDDDDGVTDLSDAYPLNHLYSKDSDTDGMPDAWETKYGLDPNDPSDAESDRDNDGVTALNEFLEGTIPSGSIDLDGNDQYDALTDGLLLLRGMFGLDGNALVTGTIASDAVFTESVEIESRIETLGDLADIDGNGDIDALTDGLLTLRYLFGLEGDTLINGVVAEDATRTSAEDIEAHLAMLKPSL